MKVTGTSQFRRKLSMLDAVIASESNTYIESVSLKLVRDLLENIDPHKYEGTEKSTLRVLEFFENLQTFRDFNRTSFPSERAKHKKLVQAHSKRTKPYRDAIRQLRKSLKEHEEAYQELSKYDDFDSQSHDQKRQDILSQIHSQNAEIKRVEIEYGKPKPYKYYYLLKTNKKNPTPKPEDVSHLKSLLSRHIKKAEKLQPHPSHQNLAKLAEFFGWSKTDLQVLEFIWATQKDDNFRALNQNILQFSSASDPAKAYFQLVGAYLGKNRDEIIKSLSSDSDMIRSGIIVMPKEAELFTYTGKKIPQINPRILNFLEETDIDLDTLQRRLFGKSTKDIPLTLSENFSFLASVTDELTKVLINMHQDPDPCHIILWGDPATGKTTYAQLLARHAGKEIVILGESQYDHATGKQKMLSPEERLNDVLFGFYVTGGSNVVRIIDDAEVLLNIAKPGRGDEKSLSKALLLRLLEEGNAIWIVNDIDAIDESVRRRFSYNVQFKPLSTNDRVKEVERMVRTSGVANLSAEEASEVAKEYVLPTGIYKTAIQHARRTNGGIDAFRRSIRASANFVYDGVANVKNSEPDHSSYIKQLANFREVKTDLEPKVFFGTAHHIVQADKTESVSILARGPYGSGKKALWRHVSHECHVSYIEADFLDLLRSPEVTTNDLLSRTNGNNTTVVWENCHPLFNGHLLTHYPHIVRMVDKTIKHITKDIMGTHVFVADTSDKAPAWLSAMFVYDLKFDYLKPQHIKEGVPKLLGDAVKVPSDARFLTPVSIKNMSHRLRVMAQFDEERLVSSMLEEAIQLKDERAKMSDVQALEKLLSRWAPKRNIPQ